MLLKTWALKYCLIKNGLYYRKEQGQINCLWANKEKGAKQNITGTKPIFSSGPTKLRFKTQRSFYHRSNPQKVMNNMTFTDYFFSKQYWVNVTLESWSQKATNYFNWDQIKQPSLYIEKNENNHVSQYILERLTKFRLENSNNTCTASSQEPSLNKKKIAKSDNLKNIWYFLSL